MLDLLEGQGLLNKTTLITIIYAVGGKLNDWERGKDLEFVENGLLALNLVIFEGHHGMILLLNTHKKN